jgi:hypothetical protein
MGADLLLVTLELPEGDAPEWYKHFSTNLASWSDDDILSLYEERFMEWPELTDEEEEEVAIRGNSIVAMKARQYYQEKIDEYFGGDKPGCYNYRDCDIHEFRDGDVKVLITGGLSWGDSPTESWDDLADISYFQ